MWKSPIEIQQDIVRQVDMVVEDGVMKAIQRFDINVDKEELIKALKYDRDQYEKGYQDGVTDTNVGGKWIPCSERLPEKRDWYLAVFKEPDTGFIGLPYIADYLMGNHTAYTTKDGWIIKDCTDRYDCESLYHKNLECVAWMPYEPYKGE